MGLFNKKPKEQTNNATQKKAELESILQSEFNTFLQSGKDRLVFNLVEVDDQTAQDYRSTIKQGWRSFKEGEHQYYEFEVLEQKEKEFVQANKQYQVAAFVQGRVLNAVNYSVPGIEIITRVHSYAKLPPFKSESLWNYNSVELFFNSNNFEPFIQSLMNSKIEKQDIQERFSKGHKSYDELTKQLMMENKTQRDFIYHKMDERNAPADEYLFREMREKISANQIENKYREMRK